MKRSKSVKLVVMGLSPLFLQACSDPQTEALVYESVDQCINDSKLTAEQCNKEYQTALDSHRKSAPKYSYSYQCETDYGPNGCQPIQSGTTTSYAPIMAAFMAPLLYRSFQPGYSPSVYSQPLYSSHYNPARYTTLDHYNVPKQTGNVKTSTRTTKKPSLKTRTVSRGGFGSQASARGGWGSGGRSSWGG